MGSRCLPPLWSFCPRRCCGVRRPRCGPSRCGPTRCRPPLRTWIPWVLHGPRQQLCPALAWAGPPAGRAQRQQRAGRAGRRAIPRCGSRQAATSCRDSWACWRDPQCWWRSPFGSNATTQKDDDGGFSEISLFREPLRNNVSGRPNIGDCFNPNTFGFKPSPAIRSNATQPPSDGVFDGQATYLGALRDFEDTWTDGGWMVWSER
jgi:hypothetical protein